MPTTQKINVRSYNEKQLTAHLDDFLREQKLDLIGKELRLGSFRFDAVAYDKDGNIVVVELKVVATKDTLPQLLLYPHVIRKQVQHLPNKPNVHALLITSHIDMNVVELAAKLSGDTITIKVCVSNENGGVKLVEPRDAGEQAWDQSLVRNINDFEIVDGRLVGKRRG